MAERAVDYKALYEDMKSRADDRLDRLEGLEEKYEELRNRRFEEGCDECEERREKTVIERDTALAHEKELLDAIEAHRKRRAPGDLKPYMDDRALYQIAERVGGGGRG